jgi:hypothetical protein
MRFLDGELQTGLFLRSLRGPPPQPRVVAAAGDLEKLTHHSHRKARLLRLDQLEGYELSLAKKAAAFFRKSRSICNRWFSRRSRRSSSRSSADSSPAAAGRASRSASAIQRRRAVSVRSRSWGRLVHRLASAPHVLHGCKLLLFRKRPSLSLAHGYLQGVLST